MKNTSSQPQEQDYRLFDSMEVRKEGVTLQAELYAWKQTKKRLAKVDNLNAARKAGDRDS